MWPVISFSYNFSSFHSQIIISYLDVFCVLTKCYWFNIWHDFFFSFSLVLGGFIQIYRDDLLLLATHDRNVAPIRYFNFATDDQLNGMYFYYDCKHVHSSAQKFTTNAHLKIFVMVFLCIQLTLFSWR